MEVNVSRVSAEEGRVLRELRLESLRDSPDAFGQTFEKASEEPDSEWQSTARASAAGDRRAWFAARDDAGAGVGLGQARRRPPHDCLVFSMWVAPRARRAGAGRALLEAVDGWARGWGARRIVLWVFGTNDGAQRFYERIGFRFVREGPDADSGSSYGAVAMERPVA